MFRFLVCLFFGFTNAAAEISFSREIAPILQQKCVTCHGPEKSKGGYRLDTFAALRKAGDSGKTPIAPGSPESSRVYQLLVTSDEADRMPQKADALAPEQIALIRRWISQRAKFDGPSQQQTLATLIPAAPRPKSPERYPFPQPILAMAWNAGGDQLGTSGYHEILLWRTNGALAGRIGDMPQRIHGIAFLKEKIAVAGGTPGHGGEVLLRETGSSAPSQTLLRIADEILALAVNSTGAILAAGGADNSIHLFDIPSGREIRALQQHADWVTALAFSPDGSRLASASRDRTARLFDSGSGELLETYAEHAQPLFAVALSADGKTVLSAGREKKIHLWAASDAKKTGDLTAGSGNITELLAAGPRLCAAGAGREILIFKEKQLERSLAGHRDWIYALAAHEASGRLASGAYDGETRIWDLATGENLATFLAMP